MPKHLRTNQLKKADTKKAQKKTNKAKKKGK
jgi:hypothetical protein